MLDGILRIGSIWGLFIFLAVEVFISDWFGLVLFLVSWLVWGLFRVGSGSIRVGSLGFL